ncbi:MAG: hypothetical protein AABW89_02955 [Nanoarchaeota archaeon]
MSFKEFREKDLGRITKTVLISLITSFVVFGIVYFFKLRYIDGLLPKFGFYIFFAILSYALIMPTLKKVRGYESLPCMSGMMIGMTVGMMAGFLPGFFVGATNGMFWGSIWGMLVGMTFGILSGKCCGIMGVMEGMMAGFMGGLMGAMTALMMFNDNLRASGVVIFIIGAIIMTGLNFLIYKETKSFERKTEIEELFTIVVSFILTTLTIWLSVFGPRSALLA